MIMALTTTGELSDLDKIAQVNAELRAFQAGVAVLEAEKAKSDAAFAAILKSIQGVQG
jgi:hypothetical protein